MDECQSAPCLNGGSCSDLRGGFACACAADWRGARCQLPRTRSCAQEPCAPGRAVCRPAPPGTCPPAPPARPAPGPPGPRSPPLPADPPSGNNYTCECFEGFVGVHCEEAFCEAQPCRHGECRAELRPPRCDCFEGWRGAWCEAERDECQEAGAGACLHGGTCIDSHAGYNCDCDDTGACSPCAPITSAAMTPSPIWPPGAADRARGACQTLERWLPELPY